MARIRAISHWQAAAASGSGDDLETEQMMMREALSIDLLRHAVTWKDRNVSLTVTEFLLLQALVQRPGFVKSRDQLIDVAYDDRIYVDDLKNNIYIKWLREKNAYGRC